MNGSQSVWEHINRTLKENGYYTTDQLINLAQENDFILENPYSWIKKGTKIAKRAIIRNGSRVDGSNVSIGEGTELLNAMIKGSDIVIGKNNLVNAHILSSHIKSGDNNQFYGKIELDHIEIGNGTTDLSHKAFGGFGCRHLLVHKQIVLESCSERRIFAIDKIRQSSKFIRRSSK